MHYVSIYARVIYEVGVVGGGSVNKSVCVHTAAHRSKHTHAGGETRIIIYSSSASK